MKALFFLLFVCFGGVAFAQTADEKAVWDRVEALNEAVFGTKDSVAIRELVSTKLTYGHSSGALEDMSAMVHNAAVSPTFYKNRSVEKLALYFVDKTAIVRYILRATSVDRGNESPLNIALLQVWAKEKNKWKLVARQAVKVNPK